MSQVESSPASSPSGPEPVGSNVAGGNSSPATANTAPGSIADVFPSFAVASEEMARRTRLLQEYVREHMTEGEDYGVVPGGSKPCLFKAGAEKLNAAFGYSPLLSVTNRFENWEAGLLAYEVKVTLVNKRTGQIEAEGIGSCNSRERRYKNQDAAGIANTLLKIAKKRALVDATLSATRSSGLFTQDLEDLDGGGDSESRGRPYDGNARPYSRPSAPATAAAANGPSDHPTPLMTMAPGGSMAPGGGSSVDLLTDAQYRAILAIAGRVYNRETLESDLHKLVEKPVEQLTKPEASIWIDRLRAILNERIEAQRESPESSPANADRPASADRGPRAVKGR